MTSLKKMDSVSYRCQPFIEHYFGQLLRETEEANQVLVVEKGKVSLPIRVELMMFRYPLGLNRVEVRSSPIHGLGVFAKELIQPGEIITFYPGDGIQFKIPGTENPETGCVEGGYMDRRDLPPEFSIEQHSLDRSKMDYYDAYLLDINESYGIIGHPELNQDMSYVGHMINDAARSSTPLDQSIYELISQLKKNAIFLNIEGLQMAVLAEATIQPGEEVFVSYSYNYWKSRHSPS